MLIYHLYIFWIQNSIADPFFLPFFLEFPAFLLSDKWKHCWVRHYAPFNRSIQLSIESRNIATVWFILASYYHTTPSPTLLHSRTPPAGSFTACQYTRFLGTNNYVAYLWLPPYLLFKTIALWQTMLVTVIVWEKLMWVKITKTEWVNKLLISGTSTRERETPTAVPLSNSLATWWHYEPKPMRERDC